MGYAWQYYAVASITQGKSRVMQFIEHGSVRGASGNGRPYREPFFLGLETGTIGIPVLLLQGVPGMLQMHSPCLRLVLLLVSITMNTSTRCEVER
jgi:hypothetical protein